MQHFPYSEDYFIRKVRSRSVAASNSTVGVELQLEMVRLSRMRTNRRREDDDRMVSFFKHEAPESQFLLQRSLHNSDSVLSSIILDLLS